MAVPRTDPAGGFRMNLFLEIARTGMQAARTMVGSMKESQKPTYFSAKTMEIEPQREPMLIKR